jgi:hypothetical protein
MIALKIAADKLKLETNVTDKHKTEKPMPTQEYPRD